LRAALFARRLIRATFGPAIEMQALRRRASTERFEQPLRRGHPHSRKIAVTDVLSTPAENVLNTSATLSTSPATG
jgi:hypothetical protein